MRLWLIGVLLGGLTVVLAPTAPSYADDPPSQPCPIIISNPASPPQCVQPWIWPDEQPGHP
jgi:hypothetical protein